jgi:subtilisin family serine protease
MKSKAHHRRWCAPALMSGVLGLLALVSGGADARAAGPQPRLSPLLSSWRSLSAQRRAAQRGTAVRLLARYTGDDTALAAAGVHLLARAGRVVSIEVPLERLDAVAALPGMQELSVPGYLRTRLDRSVPLAGGTVAQERFGLDGTGTIVGVVDTGIDVHHPDFQNPDGTTRLSYLLDFALVPDGRHADIPHPMVRLYDGADIDTALAQGQNAALPVQSVDKVGHGTHVAGIAAGSGRATGNGLPGGRYVGMAPGADLIVVQGTRDGMNLFCDADVLAGVAFILERATALGQPAVVNLSLGGQVGGHDGTHPVEEGLEALATERPGRAIVVAAGNEGDSDLHSSGQLGDGALGSASITVVVPEVPDRNGQAAHVALEIHYLEPPPQSGPQTPEAIAQGPVQVSLITPKGTMVGPVIQNQTVRSETESGEVALTHISAQPGGPPSRRGVAQVGVVVADDGDKLVAPGKWTLIVSGRTARFDAWLVDIMAGAILGTRLEGWLDPDIHLGVPATADSVIAVGAIGSRTSWTDVAGMTIQQPVPLDGPSEFSSFGPTRDGRLKPDLVAPGEYIISSLSADAPSTSMSSAFYLGSDNRGQILVADDGVHALLRGSSQAAPHVTGAAALLFSVDPTLDAVAVRDRLRAAARIDPLEEGGWNTALGAGRLQVDRALVALLGAGVGPLDPTTSSVGTARDLLAPDGALSTQVVVIPRDSFGHPLGPGHRVEVQTTAGRLVGGLTDSGGGLYTTTLSSGPRGQAAVITATVDGKALSGQARVYFGASRAEEGTPFTATGGGGCAQAGGGAGPSAAAALSLLMVLALICAHSRRDRR